MTLTFEYDLDSVKMNQRANYLGQRSFSSKVIVRTHGRQTHTPDRIDWSILTKVVVNKRYDIIHT